MNSITNEVIDTVQSSDDTTISESSLTPSNNGAGRGGLSVDANAIGFQHIGIFSVSDLDTSDLPPDQLEKIAA